jgi:hypothetical protein
MFQLCSHVTQGHILHHIVHVLATTCLLAMIKPCRCLSHCDRWNVVSIHYPCLMPPILGHLSDTFFFTPIWNNHQRREWNFGAWHSMCFRPLVKLNCPPILWLQMPPTQCQKESCFKVFLMQVGTSFNSFPLPTHFMHLSLLHL